MIQHTHKQQKFLSRGRQSPGNFWGLARRGPRNFWGVPLTQDTRDLRRARLGEGARRPPAIGAAFFRKTPSRLLFRRVSSRVWFDVPRARSARGAHAIRAL